MRSRGRQFRAYSRFRIRLSLASIAMFVLLVAFRLIFAAPGDADGLDTLSAPLVPTVSSEKRLVAPLPTRFSQTRISLFGGVKVPVPAGWQIFARDDYGITLIRGDETIRIASTKNSQATARQQFANRYPDGGAYTLVRENGIPRLHQVDDRRAEGLFHFQSGAGHDPRLTYAFYEVFGDGRSGFWYEASLPLDHDPAALWQVMRLLRAIEIP